MPYEGSHVGHYWKSRDAENQSERRKHWSLLSYSAILTVAMKGENPFRYPEFLVKF